jgi:Ca2+/Na+ antiporter
MLLGLVETKRSWETEEESSFEGWFNSMQQYPTFFVFELFAMLYIMVVLALIADELLMPSLKNIATRYKLSKDITGFIVAIGNLIPELTTTILSFLHHGVKMTEFAVATNVGASLFAMTVVPAVAAYFAPTPSFKLMEQQ